MPAQGRERPRARPYTGALGSDSGGSLRAAVYSNRRVKLAVILLTIVTVPLVGGFALFFWLFLRTSAMVDARLDEARARVPTRVFTRPVLVREKDLVSAAELTSLLNALSYEDATGRSGPLRAGQFSAAAADAVVVWPRATGLPPAPPGKEPVPWTLTFARDRAGRDFVRTIRSGSTAARNLDFGSALLSYLYDDGSREKRRFVTYDELPKHLVNAVLAIEDRRFFQHPGFDPFRIASAALRNVRRSDGTQHGGSTLTQQFVKNFFLTPEKTLRRKVQEALVSFILETRATKQEIFELYVNEIYLGQVGSFSINGVGEAARVFFEKDVGNLSLVESALLAGMIQSPNPYNPMRHPERAKTRRDAVLSAMVESGSLTEADRKTAVDLPVEVKSGARPGLDAPYFLDVVTSDVKERFGVDGAHNLALETTLDLRLQRVAQAALEKGLADLDAKIKRPDGQKLQGALVALDARTGGILALAGGRSYGASQFNRALQAKRQMGSTFKPFVYLAAFEATLDDPSLPPITPATVVDDTPYVFFFEDKEYIPQNFEDQYLGPVTLRRALAKSLNVATVKVAELIGYERVSDLWRNRMRISSAVRAFPAIALGAFEASPMEVATAYGVLASGGRKHPPFALSRVLTDGGGVARDLPLPPATEVVRPETTFLITSMLRSVMNEGTGAGSRGMGFSFDAAGKSGTTNDERDAWFAGYTPDIVTIVWVGYDDNAPVTLAGSRAALPIWVDFMKVATAGLGDRGFVYPEEGVVFVEIDKATGRRYNPECGQAPFLEAFLVGTEPMEIENCDGR